jgi:hypothetical protein
MEEKEEERAEKQAGRVVRLESFRDGRDEMNLAELPLAAVSSRFLDGRKTVVFEDQAWDEGRREFVPRKLTISGSDRYGLPTAKDDDVLLACIQLTSLGNFHSREVEFSRYELLKLLRWKDETKNYRRVSSSLRRWKGVTVYSDRAFYDHGRKSWVNRDFGILDNLYIYQREEREGVRAPASSWLAWNEVLFESFRSGYLKRLDWDLYCRLADPVAKRLYRLLDKRFYHRDRVVFDLEDLAFNKVRVSRGYNAAQTKRALMNGIRELEALWELRAMEPEKRFSRLGPGKWEVVFERKAKRKRAEVKEESGLVKELVGRGVSTRVADKLVSKEPEEKVRRMIRLFDWLAQHGQKKGAGFLVASIKNEEGYRLPEGLEKEVERVHSNSGVNSRKEAKRDFRKRTEEEDRPEEKPEDAAFQAFWAGLGEGEREAFEAAAVEIADNTKRGGYERCRRGNNPLFEGYRRVILRDHFRRISEGGAGATE